AIRIRAGGCNIGASASQGDHQSEISCDSSCGKRDVRAATEVALRSICRNSEARAAPPGCKLHSGIVTRYIGCWCKGQDKLTRQGDGSCSGQIHTHFRLLSGGDNIGQSRQVHACSEPRPGERECSSSHRQGCCGGSRSCGTKREAQVQG